MHRRVTVLLAASLFCLLGLAEAAAATTTLTTGKLKEILTGLGYDGAVNEKLSNVRIDDQGTNHLSVFFQLTDDGATITIYSLSSDIPDDRMAALPGQAMLKANSFSKIVYSIASDSETNKPDVMLGTSVDAALINPPLLRHTIDDLNRIRDDGESLFDPAKWPAPGATTASTAGKKKAE